VLKTMSEILRNEENEDFASMLEQSLESEKIYNGKRVIGIVTHVSSNEVHVDVGAKQAGIIPANEMSDDPNVKIEDLVKPGDEIELSVVKVNDQEGIVTLSKKRCDAAAGFDKLKKAFEANEAVDGVITDVIRGGVLVYAFGTKIFVPASQCYDHHIDDLNTLLKTPVKFKVIEVNEARNRAKGSVKAVASIEREALQEKFWETAEIGKTYTGAVKSLTGYGAFVDLGGIDGMIHISELSWGKIAHPSEVVKQGDVVDVYIKDLDKEKKRVSLGYKKSKDNPFNIFKEKYSIGDVASAKIVSFTNYGAFAEIMDGVDGLIHISQIANKHVDKIADV
ncbi:MAG: S1 RNA-binding domain-containing protein, partial [Oscillospiraceae bacterium]